MVNVVRGSISKHASTQKLINYLKARDDIEGALYLGYPIISTSEGAYHIDGLLVSKKHGIVVFDIVEGVEIENRKNIQDDIFNKIRAELLSNSKLSEGRKLMVELEIITYAPAWTGNDFDYKVATNNEELERLLEKQTWERSEEYYESLVADIQAVTKIKETPNRNNVVKENSRGAKLKKLEETIANLDRQQSRAVIETVDGVQRIRGLAGSGKTIVLALKVAYLHSKHPDWDIAVTFRTRSLKDQFESLITRFTIEHKNEKPNWNKVNIIHSWGSSKTTGIYYEVCKAHNIEYFDYSTARKKLSETRGDEFEKVCQKALEDISDYKQLFDVILVDEAQDFSEAYLNLCYNILKEPKRLVYAYDELQKLNEASMREPEQIFGEDENGDPKVILRNKPNKPKQDIILKICYRNSRPILVTAHALGFGVYREEGLVQMFEEEALWKEIGYKKAKGELTGGERAVLKRTAESSPEFLEEHSKIDDIVKFKCLNNKKEQINWIANQIEKNLKEDELTHRDIIVIHVNPIKTKDRVGPLRKLLYEKDINSHLTGVTTSPDNFYKSNSITITSVYRAKGNEAPMVYVMDSQYCYGGKQLIKKRNSLFTAISRSKAWVRVCGYGNEMEKLNEEFKKIKENDFKLDFVYPTKEEMEKMNIINRGLTKDEKEEIEEASQSLQSIIEGIKEGKIYKEDLPPELVDELKELL
jgi:superfamily I DNA and RNA helicase